MKKTLMLITALTLAGTASAATTQNGFDRAQVEVTTTNLGLGATPYVGGTVNLTGQEFLGVQNGVAYYLNLNAGITGRLATQNSSGLALVGAEVLAKSGQVTWFAGVTHYRIINDWREYANAYRVGVRVGELVK